MRATRSFPSIFYYLEYADYSISFFKRSTRIAQTRQSPTNQAATVRSSAARMMASTPPARGTSTISPRPTVGRTTAPSMISSTPRTPRSKRTNQRRSTLASGSTTSTITIFSAIRLRPKTCSKRRRRLIRFRLAACSMVRRMGAWSRLSSIVALPHFACWVYNP